MAEFEKIASDASAPTFENTVIALERSGELLTRATKVFFMIVQANADDELQNVRSEEVPKLAALNDALYLNDKLFQRVKSVYDRRENLPLDAVQKFLVKRLYIDFVRSGALLPESDKAKLRVLNQEEATLMTDFQNKLLAATKAGGLVIEDKKFLDGMSDAEIAAAA